MIEASHAPGWPGSSPRWTSSAKSGVGTAINPISRVWFTLSHGILNEIYYPRVDMACTRDMGLMVSDGQTFVSEEKRHTAGQVSYMEEGALAYRLVNTCFQGRYLIEKEVITDPHRDVLLQRTRFTALKGNPDDYHLYVVLAPHLGNRGAENTGWVGDYKGVPMLFAERDGCALALACSSPWALRSVGFVGVSDGWQDVTHHRRMEWLYERAEKGNIALTGEINLSRDEFVLALGFGSSVAEAGQNARTSLLDGFPAALRDYIQQWTDWQRTVYPLSESCLQEKDLYRVSMAVLRAHEAAGFPGGIIASLSIPWGFQNGDEDLGGYHLVWPRDLVEAVVGMLAG